MKLFKAIRCLAWLSVIPLLGLSLSAHAIGTNVGTTISNTATLSYSVGGTGQANLSSNTVNFVVDNRLDLTVLTTNAARVGVVPGQTGAVLTFTVTNTGNSTQDYSLSAANNATDPFGGAENFDPSAFSVFVEDGTTPGGYQPLEDTATYIDELSSNPAGLANQATVYIVSTIPGVRVNGDIAALTLTAQVAVGGTAAALGADITTDDSAIVDNPLTVQTVFGDAAGDTDAVTNGQHSDSSAYEVQSAIISISKASTVVWDPINDTSNPKAIPGAAVRYSITISNGAAASASATLTQISDALNANITFDPSLTTDNTATPMNAVGDGFRVTHTATNRLLTSATQYFTTATADDAAEHDGTNPGGNVTVTLSTALPAEAGAPINTYSAGELKPNESVTIDFHVIIQ